MTVEARALPGQTEVWPGLKDKSKPTSLLANNRRIYRTERIAGETYAKKPSTLSEEHLPYGPVQLRFDHHTAQRLGPRSELVVVDAAYNIAELQIGIDGLVSRQAIHQERIQKVRRSRRNFRGAELAKLGKTVTVVTEVGLTPDYEAVRQAVGEDAISKIGFEKLTTELTLPPGIRAQDVKEALNLALQFKGINPTDSTTVSHKVGMKVTNRELLIDMANRGEIPIEALHPDPKDKLVVDDITPPRSRSRAKGKSESTS